MKLKDLKMEHSPGLSGWANVIKNDPHKAKREAGESESKRKRFEDATLQAVKMEGVAMR